MEFDRIPDDATGKWRTTTENGTTHDWDFDAYTFKRNPSSTSRSRGMPPSFNEKTHHLRSIGAPAIVGSSFLVFLVDGTYINSSEVVKVERL